MAFVRHQASLISARTWFLPGPPGVGETANPVLLLRCTAAAPGVRNCGHREARTVSHVNIAKKVQVADVVTPFINVVLIH